MSEKVSGLIALASGSKGLSARFKMARPSLRLATSALRLNPFYDDDYDDYDDDIYYYDDDDDDIFNNRSLLYEH